MILLDCIIFGLQQYGGISNYWMRLLESYKDDFPNLVLPRYIHTTLYKEELFSHFSIYRESRPILLSRYLACPVNGTCDVFHTSYYRLPAHKSAHYIVTAYDFMYERYRKGPWRWVHTNQKRRSLERADTIACISSFTRDDVLEFFPQVDPARLHVIPLGVDTDVFYPDPQLGRDSALAMTVLFVGLRSGYKRFDLAVHALQASEANLVLGIVGPQLSTDELELLQHVLTNRWRYFGNVSASDLRALYSSAYALILPSDCEGFGLPVLEAMACNCPVVAAHRTSLPEVGGKAALYAREQCPDDYAEALCHLSDDSLRRRIITDGAARIMQFSWAETCRKTRALYNLVT